MKKILQIAEGLTLLAPFDEDGFSVAVEHDVLWAGPSNVRAVPAEAIARLIELGWFVDDDVDRWSIFV